MLKGQRGNEMLLGLKLFLIYEVSLICLYKVLYSFMGARSKPFCYRLVTDPLSPLRRVSTARN